jgi:putative ABC transport system permease protein
MISDVMYRLRALFRRRSMEAELEAELCAHVEHQVEKYVQSGMSREEAKRQAKLKFGGVEQVKEECRDGWGIRLITELGQDVRYGLRQLRRSPGFTAVAVITLALGIGANTAIFSIVNAVLLRPLPYRDPSRLVYISEFWPRETPVRTVPSPDFANWSAHAQLFDGLAAYGGGAEVNLRSEREPERVQGVRVTAGFFSLLGVQPFRGRGFLPEEDRPGGPHVVLLSYELWQELFGSDMNAVGKSVDLDGIPYTIVGIMPAGFRMPDDEYKPRLFLPMLVARAAQWGSHDPNVAQLFRLVRPLARLKHGVTVEQARQELTALVRRTASQEPPQFIRMRAGMEVHVTPLEDRLAGPVRPILLVLLSSVALLLVMTCANLAGLQLARGVTRQKEMAVRAALGASHFRLVEQMLTESMALAMLTVPVALLVGWLGLKALLALAPPQIPDLAVVRLDPFVLAFTVIVAAMTGLLFGLSPALFAFRTEPDEALKQSGRSGIGREQHHARSLLVTAEVALAVVLLVGAGLLTRSFLHLILIDPGFNPHNLMTFRLTVSGGAYSEPREQAAFFGRILDRLRAMPGIRSADAGSRIPVLGWWLLAGTDIEGQPQMPAGLRPDIPADVVTPGYFRTLGIPLVTGREFSDQDRAGAPAVAIVNGAFVRQYFPDQNPLGKHVRTGDRNGPWREIVGVVGNVRQLGPDHPGSTEIYTPFLQDPSPDMCVVLRASTNYEIPLATIRAVVREVDASQPVYGVATMDERLWESVAPQRLNALLIGVFALLALGLEAVGVYGVLAYSVNQRTHEIGIRMALGAEEHNILTVILGQGMRMAGAGIAVGIVGALGFVRLLAGLLFGVKPTDVLTFVVVSLLLLAVALASSFIPAQRAMKVDPMVALRNE